MLPSDVSDWICCNKPMFPFPSCLMHGLLVKMCTNCQTPYAPHWASVWQTELTPGCLNPGFKLGGWILAVVDSLFSCYFLNFELNSRTSECQMRSSEGLRDQLAALIDISPKNQWEKNKQLNSPKTRVFDWSLSRLCKHSTLNFIRCVWKGVGGQEHLNNPKCILPDLRALSQNSAIQLWLRHVIKSHILWPPHRQIHAYTQTLTHTSSC